MRPGRIVFLVMLAVLALPAPALAARGTGSDGPSIAFVSPAPGTLSYARPGGVTLRWTETGTNPDAPHRLIRQLAPIDVNGGCTGIDWEPADEWDVTGLTSREVGNHRAGTCYRYRLVIEGSKLTVESAPSGSIRIVSSWTGTYNIYRSGSFSTQKTYTWCVGASVQMMSNIIRGEQAHGADGQSRYMKYARAHDRLPNEVSPGSDPKGWAAALRYHTGVTNYEWREHRSYSYTLRHAAARLRKTGRPIGLLMARGGHAWVMTGFDATADPAVTGDFEVTHVYVSGPLYPMQQRNGYDRPPNTRLSVGTLSSYLVRFRGIPRENSMIWDGSFVTITP